MAGGLRFRHAPVLAPLAPRGRRQPERRTSTRYIEVANPFAEKLDPARSTAERYPLAVAAGSLAAALDAALRARGSSLRSERGFYGARSASSASLSSGNWDAQVDMAARERLFLLGLWEKESQIAKGKTSELADVASAIRVCLEKKQRGSNLVLQLPFVRVTDSGASYERGTFVDDAWQRFLEGGLTRRNNEAFHWDELERFIRLASERPERRRLLPYTSEFRFSVTPLSRPPDNVVPVVWPLGNGRFMVTSSGAVSGLRAMQSTSSMRSSTPSATCRRGGMTSRMTRSSQPSPGMDGVLSWKDAGH